MGLYLGIKVVKMFLRCHIVRKINCQVYPCALAWIFVKENELLRETANTYELGIESGVKKCVRGVWNKANIIEVLSCGNKIKNKGMKSF